MCICISHDLMCKKILKKPLNTGKIIYRSKHKFTLDLDRKGKKKTDIYKNTKDSNIRRCSLGCEGRHANHEATEPTCLVSVIECTSQLRLYICCEGTT